MKRFDRNLQPFYDDAYFRLNNIGRFLYQLSNGACHFRSFENSERGVVTRITIIALEET